MDSSLYQWQTAINWFHMSQLLLCSNNFVKPGLVARTVDVCSQTPFNSDLFILYLASDDTTNWLDMNPAH